MPSRWLASASVRGLVGLVAELDLLEGEDDGRHAEQHDEDPQVERRAAVLFLVALGDLRQAVALLRVDSSIGRHRRALRASM